MRPALSAKPRLTAGAKLNDKSQRERVLLVPGREIKLIGPSLEIVKRCDGKHTVQQIAEVLHEIYAKAEPQRVTEDLLGYLGLLHNQKAIEF
jgi:hypothetical protein